MEIKIENLTKAYGDFKAVDNMNLNIADGELVGLLGPSKVKFTQNTAKTIGYH